MSRQPFPAHEPDRPLDPRDSGRGLLRIAPVVAIAVLLVNDHILKAASPGVLTGKLSDIVGLVFFPLLLVAAVELVASAAGRPIQRPGRLLVWAIVVTGVAFAFVKVAPVATAAWEAVLGFGQWPLAIVIASANQLPIPPWPEVSAVTDPTDLVALPALLLAWLDGRRRLLDRTRRTHPAALRIRPGFLPIGALLVAGLASLATQPATGLPTTAELESHVDLTREHPVAIQSFELTADASAIEGQMDVDVGAVGDVAGVRYILVFGDRHSGIDFSNGGASVAGLELRSCGADACSQTFSLITELLDPSEAAVSVTTTLRATSKPSTANQQLASDRIGLVERGETSFRAAPSVVSGQLSGEVTLGPSNPGVDIHIAIHVDPAAVSDPSQLILRGLLRLEAPDGPTEVVVNTGYPKLYEPGQRVALADPHELSILVLRDCPRTKVCDFDYVVRLTAADAAHIRWGVALEIVDYDAENAPDGRVITIELKDTTATDQSAPSTTSVP